MVDFLFLEINMHTKNNREKEVKFFISDKQAILDRLSFVGAILIKQRVYENNLRFDTSDHSLRNQHQVLRLRKDDQIHLTFKDQPDLSAGIADRRELEITVNDFDTARSLLEALGYHVFMIYEKYRTTFTLNHCEVVLDEMPFGTFIEIEGETLNSIQATARLLNKDWDKRISASYLELFQILQNNKRTSAQNILFSEFPASSFSEKDFKNDPLIDSLV